MHLVGVYYKKETCLATVLYAPLPPSYLLMTMSQTRDQIIDMIHLHVPRQTAEGRCDSLRCFRYMTLRKFDVKAKLLNRRARFYEHMDCVVF